MDGIDKGTGLTPEPRRVDRNFGSPRSIGIVLVTIYMRTDQAPDNDTGHAAYWARTLLTKVCPYLQLYLHTTDCMNRAERSTFERIINLQRRVVTIKVEASHKAEIFSRLRLGGIGVMS